MSDFDLALAFVKIVSTSVGEEGKQVLGSLAGFSDGLVDEEVSGDEPLSFALGLLARPMPADADGYAEAVAARLEDGLLPLGGARDLRLSKRRGNMNPGAQSLVGYGGSFVNIEPAADGTGDVISIYAPYEHDGGGPGKGTPAKALGITISTSTGEESITIAHALGMAVILNFDGTLTMRSNTGDARIILDGDTITIQAQKVFVLGNVVLGAQAAGAQALVASVTNSPSVWFSTV